jgi:DNA processing protein
MIAVIGSRQASAFSLDVSFRLGFELAKRSDDTSIVSGGAWGCDIAVHEGALASCKNPCPAIVVFAGGLKNLYPRINKNTFEALGKHNALFLSERLWDQPARPRDFHARNRIISGLSQQIIVVQAGIRSGAMITAKAALDQGRDVLVLVQPFDDIRADGNKQLLLDGAAGFHSAEGYFSNNFVGLVLNDEKEGSAVIY